MSRPRASIARVLYAAVLVSSVVGGGAAGFLAMLRYLDTPSIPSRDMTRTVFFRSGSDGAKLLGAGWSSPEPWGTWSDGPRAELAWRLADKPVSDIRVRVEGRLFPNQGDRTQTIEVHVNDAHVGTIESGLEGDMRQSSFAIPLDVAVKSNPVRIVFKILRPTAPRELGGGEDGRKLGLGLTAMTLQYRSIEAGLRGATLARAGRADAVRLR